MNRGKKFAIIDLVGPLFGALLFTVNVLYNGLFGWWLDPQIQRGRNRKFLDDIEASLGRLVSEGKIVDQDRPNIMPFDGATVKVIYQNIIFDFTRGRGDLAVSLAPRHVPNEEHELGPLVATLEGRLFSEHDVVNSLSDVEGLLMPRLDSINSAFSEENYAKL
jgi:hypothetical protein